MWRNDPYVCSSCLVASYARPCRIPAELRFVARPVSEFSTSSHLGKTSDYWSKAPSTRKKMLAPRPKQAAPAAPKPKGSNMTIAAMIKAAVSSGVIAVSAEKAIQIMNEFKDLSKGGASPDAIPGKNAVAELCDKHGVKPLLLFILGLLLRRTAEGKSQGRKLTYAASAAGDASATIYLCSWAQEQKKIRTSDFFEPRKHLLKIVEEGNNPHAMVLAGHIALSEGNEARALELYEKGVELDKSRDASEDITESIYSTLAAQDPSNTSGVRDGWRALGKLKLSKGDMKGAKEAFERGAELQDPLAYLFLAEFLLKEDRNSIKWFEYVTKAAASGIAEATLKLGNFYLENQTVGWERTGKENGMAMEPKLRMELMQYRRVNAGEVKERVRAIEHRDPSERNRLAGWWFDVGCQLAHRESILASIQWQLSHGNLGNAESRIVRFEGSDDEKEKFNREAQKLIIEWKRKHGQAVT